MTNATDFLSSFSSYSKDSFAATKELFAINAELANKLLEKQIGFAGMMIEAGEKQLDIASVTEPKEYVAKQTAIVEETTAKVADAAQSTSVLFQEAGEDFKVWFEKGAKTAEETVKKAAADAAKVAA
jgi:hypothetical protein